MMSIINTAFVMFESDLVGLLCGLHDLLNVCGIKVEINLVVHIFPEGLLFQTLLLSLTPGLQFLGVHVFFCIIIEAIAVGPGISLEFLNFFDHRPLPMQRYI